MARRAGIQAASRLTPKVITAVPMKVMGSVGLKSPTRNIDSGLVMSRSVTMRDLEIGMTIEADVMSQRGARLVPRGTEVTSTVLERLRAVAGGIGLVEPIRVSVKVLD